MFPIDDIDKIAANKRTKTIVKPEIRDLGFRQIIEIILFVIFCGIFLKFFVLNLSLISSNSMLPVLQKGDIVLISRLNWFVGLPGEFSGISSGRRSEPRLWYREIHKGEIAAFKPDPELNKGDFTNDAILVKRVCGIPGDQVIKYHSIYSLVEGMTNGDSTIFIIPGREMDIKLSIENLHFYLPYIESEGARVIISGSKIIINGSETNRYKFRRDYFFMKGDNSKVSYDSKYFGLVPSTGIVGKPVLVLWNSYITSNFFKLIN